MKNSILPDGLDLHKQQLGTKYKRESIQLNYFIYHAVEGPIDIDIYLVSKIKNTNIQKVM